MKKLNEILNKIKEAFGKLNKLGVLLVVLVFILGVLYYFRGYFIVATINGEPITRFAVLNKLEKASGKTALDSMITEMLVKQQAKAQNITVPQQDIDAEIAKIRTEVQTSGQDLNSLLALQGMTITQLQDQIRLQKIAEKIVAAQITVTDADVTVYIEANKASLPPNYVLADIKPTIVQQLQSEKFATAFQSWLGQAKQKASINYLMKY